MKSASNSIRSINSSLVRSVMVAENEDTTFGGALETRPSQEDTEPREVSDIALPGHHATAFAQSAGLSLPIGRPTEIPENIYKTCLEALRYLIPDFGGLQDTIFGYQRQRTSQYVPGEQYVAGDHILLAEIRRNRPAQYYDVGCDDSRSKEGHAHLLSGKGNPDEVAIRYLVLEDLSERTIEVLGRLDIPPGVLMKHLHQTLASRSVDTFTSFRGQSSVYPWRWDSNLRFQKGAPIFQTTCPVDIYLVPSLREKSRVRALQPSAESNQAKGYPHASTVDFGLVPKTLATWSFMEPSISRDVGPYVPLLYMLHPFDDQKFGRYPVESVPKFTLERSDTITIYSADHTEIPTVLVLRPPSIWNHSIPHSMLPGLRTSLSNNDDIQWQTAPTEDPLYVRVSEFDALNGKEKSIPDEFRHKIYAPERASLNLCQILVDLHVEICGTSSQRLVSPTLVARVLILERSINALINRANDDWRATHEFCDRTKMDAKTERLRLEYFDRRATRTRDLVTANDKTLQDLTICVKLESDHVRQATGLFLGQLALLKDQTDELISRTRLFLSRQLASLSRNEQEILFQNQIDLSKVQIRESQRAIQQTETVRKLTLLAFIFIPAGTVCSFFGMNIKELDGRPHFWIFFVSLVSVLLLVLLIAMAGCIHVGFMRFLATLPTLPIAGGPRVSKLRKYTGILMFLSLHVPYAIICFSWRSTVRMWTRLRAEGEEYYRGYDEQLMGNSKPFPEDDEGTPHYQQGARTGFRLESYLDCFRGDDQDHIVT